MLDTAWRLADSIDVNEQRLPPSTTTTDTDMVAFAQTHVLWHKECKATVKVGSSSVLIQSSDKHKILSHQTTLTDVFFAHEIDEVGGIYYNLYMHVDLYGG